MEEEINNNIPVLMLKAKLQNHEKAQLRYLLSLLIHYNESLTLKDLIKLVE